jgi:uncharacterized protein YndB with AHSA1/START domain
MTRSSSTTAATLTCTLLASGAAMMMSPSGAAANAPDGAGDRSVTADAHLAPLARYVGGEWVADGVLPDGQAFHAREVYEWTLDGRAMRARLYMQRPDGSEYHRYESLCAWDAAAGAIVYHGYASDGSISHGEIHILADGTHNYPSARGADGARTGFRNTVRFIDDNTFHWTLFQQDGGGEERAVIEATWRRQTASGSAPAPAARGPAAADTIAPHTGARSSAGDLPGPGIAVETVVNAPLEEVWRCWTTSDGAQTFFAPRANIEARPGGMYEILFMPDNPPDQRGAEGVHVLSLVPMEMLSFEWSAPPQFPHARANPLWVVVTLVQDNDARTRVRLRHLGFDDAKMRFPDHAGEWDAVQEYFSKAWPYVLNNLKRRFEDGPRWDERGRERWTH